MSPITASSAAALLLCLGCGSDAQMMMTAASAMTPPVPVVMITELRGEVHLHEFPMGSHAWAGFLAQPVALADVHGDQLISFDSLPTQREGQCTLYLTPTCAPACGASSYCQAPNQCAPLSPTAYVDGGPLWVHGSRVVDPIRLWFASAQSPYDADPAPGFSSLFAGGETLQISGGQGAFALSGSVPAPLPVQVLVPDLSVPVHFPRSGPLALQWKSSGAEQMVISLYASASDGSDGSPAPASGRIRCLCPDSGDFTVPADLLAALPPPPRLIRLELERDEERVFPTAQPGVGVLIHAAFSAWQNSAD